MKKYFKTSILCVLTGLFLVSCASTPKVPFDAANVSPAAIISITANDEITWYGESTEKKTGLLNMAINKAVKENADDTSLAYLGFTKNLLDDSELQQTKYSQAAVSHWLKMLVPAIKLPAMTKCSNLQVLYLQTDIRCLILTTLLLLL